MTPTKPKTRPPTDAQIAKAKAADLAALQSMLETQRGVGDDIDGLVYRMVTKGGWTTVALGDALGLSKSEISRRKVRYEANHLS